MLSDDDLIQALRSARQPEPPGADGLADRVIHRHRVRHRRVRTVQIALPVTALVAAVVLVGLGTRPADPARSRTATGASPSASTSPGTPARTGIPTQTTATGATEPAEVSLSLDGYRLNLPRTFATTADTNCTSQLHLASTERSRLIRTPDADCPLLIASVTATLPASAIEVTAQVPRANDVAQTVRFFRVVDPVSHLLIGYLPARLPGGTTVYIVLDARTPATSKQLLQLEQGLRVGLSDAPGGS